MGRRVGRRRPSRRHRCPEGHLLPVWYQVSGPPCPIMTLKLSPSVEYGHRTVLDGFRAAPGLVISFGLLDGFRAEHYVLPVGRGMMNPFCNGVLDLGMAPTFGART